MLYEQSTQRMLSSKLHKCFRPIAHSLFLALSFSIVPHFLYVEFPLHPHSASLYGIFFGLSERVYHHCPITCINWIRMNIGLCHRQQIWFVSASCFVTFFLHTSTSAHSLRAFVWARFFQISYSYYRHWFLLLSTMLLLLVLISSISLFSISNFFLLVQLVLTPPFPSLSPEMSFEFVPANHNIL